MTATAHTVPGTATAMAEAASLLLDLLDDSQLERMVAGFPGEPERSRWFYNPSDHGGLTLTNCTPAQRVAALRLLATGLSQAGYNTAAAIMGHELILERQEDWPVLPGWGRVRDPLHYAVAIFGEPGSDEWAWRFAGHHLSLHYTIVGGALAAATPSFFGADPAEAPLPGGGTLRPCAALEDLGRDLVRSLDEGQLAAALLAPQAPPDIVTGNRPVLEGRLWVVPPRERFRAPDKLLRAVLGELEARLAAAEQALGPAAMEALAWSRAPAGCPGRGCARTSGRSSPRCWAPTWTGSPTMPPRPIGRRSPARPPKTCTSPGPAVPSPVSRTTTGSRAPGCSPSTTTPSAAATTSTPYGATRPVTSAVTSSPTTTRPVTDHPH